MTLFPKIFEGFLSESLILRGLKKKIISIKVIDLRKFAQDKHRTVDDRPFGGGPGMVMKVDVVDKAIKSLKSKIKDKKSKIILLTPQGEKFNQKLAQTLSSCSNLILICGHYEGFDERIRQLVNLEISIGDYILTGGEIPAMAVIDAVARLVPGVVGKTQSLKEESFSFENWKLKIGNLLEYPQYTRPENYQGMKVPKILLSGNHQKISQWRKQQAFKKTLQNRPDLLKQNEI